MDELIQDCIFGDSDMDLFSAAQVTDLVAAYLIEDADAEAKAQLDGEV